MLDYFGGITDSLPEPLPEVWRGDGGLGEFTLQRTEDILAAAKKTNSMIASDPLPNLIKKFPKQFATPIADIFNAVNITGRWPSDWKTEHLTIIPKNPNPASLAECRNISCTSVFSKLLEGQVLAKIRKELKQDLTQYGGTPKFGAEHMLIDIWDEILGSMEGGKNAAVLLGEDYEKAFNRMEHSACHQQLRVLGASSGSLSMVRSFLEGRKMSIKIGFHTAPARAIVRGSPQGSVVGSQLYCATTQLLTLKLQAGGIPAVPDPGPFTFSQTPSAGAHVEMVKFRAKVWMLYNLRRAGFKRKQLFRLYCCYLRSIVEYSSAVYHSLLNRAQEEALEKLHRHAIIICYGFDVDVETTMMDNGIETLRTRRIRRCDAFIRRAMTNERFGQRWFQARPPGDRTLRRKREIVEPRAALLRRFRSPLAFMARRANELASAPLELYEIVGIGEGEEWI